MSSHKVMQWLVVLMAIIALLGCSGSNPMHEDAAENQWIGDINLNEQPFEIADSVLFANYFVHGAGVFSEDQMTQIAATDCNRDGVVLSLADLQYLIRMVVGDALPYERLNPDTVRVTISDGQIAVDQEVGLASIVARTDHPPVLLADQMDMLYQFDGEYCRILVWSLGSSSVLDGDILTVQGDIIGIELATYDGAPVVVLQD